MKLSVVIMLCVMPFSLLAIKKAKEPARAPRPDALSYFGSTPEIVSPFDTAQLAQIQECICSLKNITESGFDVIESLLDALSSCGPISITESGDITLSTPGYYCLVNDVGNITITSSFVVLNMSERIAESLTISGVASGGISHVIVTNGFIYNAPQVQSDSLQINTADEVAISNIQIDSDPSAPAQNHGIHILNSGNVSVSDSHISRSRHGIYVQSTDSVRIDQTSIINSGVYGVKAGTLQDNSLVSITNSFIDHSLTDGINSDSGNLYVVNTKIVNSVGTGVYSSSLYCYCSDVIVDTCGSYCFYWLSNSKIEAENCTALNYGITGFEFDGGTALFSNCVASSTVTSFQVSGFVFRFNVEAAVMYNCTSYNNSGDGFLFVANSGLFTISDCTAYNNQDKGFDVRNTGGAFTFSNCTAYQNSNFGFYATAIAKSVALAFDNCVATLNGGDGFSMIAQISKFSSCSASANQGNGFSANGGTAIVVNCYSSSNVLDGFHIINNQALVLPYAVTLVMQNCVATANSQYGFYDGTANTMRNLSYTGNVAVANVVGNYNAAKGATPFFYKLAKDTAVNVFDNVLAELIV